MIGGDIIAAELPKVRRNQAAQPRGIHVGQAAAVAGETVRRVVQGHRAGVVATELGGGEGAAQLTGRQRAGEVAGRQGIRRGRQRLARTQSGVSRPAAGGSHADLQPARRSGGEGVVPEIQGHGEQPIADADWRQGIGCADRIPARERVAQVESKIIIPGDRNAVGVQAALIRKHGALAPGWQVRIERYDQQQQRISVD